MASRAQRRVIINTDAKNEADDQFAIVHALLSPTLDVRGLIAAHFGTERSRPQHGGVARGDRPAAGPDGPDRQVTVANGAPTGIPDEQTPLDSPGAQLIIAESKLASDGRSAVRRLPRPVDRHGVGDPARPGDRRTGTSS